MHRVNTSRQTVSSKQCNANYRLSHEVAPHVLASTMKVEGASFQVKGATATSSFRVGRLTIEKGQYFWFIRSTCAQERYYLVTRNTARQYESSAVDERVEMKCVREVEEYRFQRSLKKCAAGYKPAEQVA